ncbi:MULTISPECIES: FecR domain-containing protein [unclassified Azospirillum]|uniref:FecR family protein n=1 Tax=unclassified Azospirillum TaxID=2630922 RepID=UPI000B68858F|nr:MULTISPECIES: FecR domain-containing protein [unclassified Azospirillum]SNS14172.1 FecR family protein [Azospirillum sp. RU38E]SNS31331.1 FecR family protein [Azospirillum sp. RU37A]
MITGEPEQRILDQAAEWMRLSASGKLGPDQQAALKAWLQASPDHVAAMDIVSRAWIASGAINDQGRMRPDMLRARNFRIARSSSTGRSWRGPLLAGFGMGAACLLAVIGWQGAVTEADYASGPGEGHSIMLADGTLVRLDAGTRLHVRIDPLSRQVTLHQGEAEFDVVHEKLRPFTVAARGLVVHDLGTRFTVRHRADKVRVVLLEGAADVRDAQNGRVLTVLKPGQQVESQAQGAPLRLTAANLGRVLAWRDRQAVFEDTPLTEALAEVEARTGVRMRLADPALSGLKVSGVFHTADISGFLNALTLLHPLSWRQTAPGEYQLEPRRR